MYLGDLSRDKILVLFYGQYFEYMCIVFFYKFNDYKLLICNNLTQNFPVPINLTAHTQFGPGLVTNVSNITIFLNVEKKCQSKAIYSLQRLNSQKRDPGL
jgi:hypothetical protein